MRNLLKIFTSKSEYSKGSWALTLPRTFSLQEEEGDVVTLASDNGFRALQISSYIKDAPVSDNDLFEVSEEMSNARHKLNVTTQGEFKGFATEATDDGNWFRSWFLRCNSTMLFATYVCDVDDRGVEDQLVEEVLSSLTYKRQ